MAWSNIPGTLARMPMPGLTFGTNLFGGGLPTSVAATADQFVLANEGLVNAALFGGGSTSLNVGAFACNPFAATPTKLDSQRILQLEGAGDPGTVQETFIHPFTGKPLAAADITERFVRGLIRETQDHFYKKQLAIYERYKAGEDLTKLAAEIDEDCKMADTEKGITGGSARVTINNIDTIVIHWTKCGGAGQVYGALTNRFSNQFNMYRDYSSGLRRAVKNGVAPKKPFKDLRNLAAIIQEAVDLSKLISNFTGTNISPTPGTINVLTDIMDLLFRKAARNITGVLDVACNDAAKTVTISFEGVIPPEDEQKDIADFGFTFAKATIQAALKGWHLAHAYENGRTTFTLDMHDISNDVPTIGETVADTGLDGDSEGRRLLKEMEKTGVPDVLLGAGVYVHDDRYYKPYGSRISGGVYVRSVAYSSGDFTGHEDDDRVYLADARASGKDSPSVIVGSIFTDDAAESATPNMPAKAGEKTILPITFEDSAGNTHRTNAAVEFKEDGYHVSARPLKIGGTTYQPVITTGTGFLFGDRVMFGDTFTISYKTKEAIEDDLATTFELPLFPYIAEDEIFKEPLNDSVVWHKASNSRVYMAKSADLLLALSEIDDVAFTLTKQRNGANFILFATVGGLRDTNPHTSIGMAWRDQIEDRAVTVEGYIRRYKNGLAFYRNDATEPKFNYQNQIFYLTGLLLPAVKRDVQEIPATAFRKAFETANAWQKNPLMALMQMAGLKVFNEFGLTDDEKATALEKLAHWEIASLQQMQDEAVTKGGGRLDTYEALIAMARAFSGQATIPSREETIKAIFGEPPSSTPAVETVGVISGDSLKTGFPSVVGESGLLKFEFVGNGGTIYRSSATVTLASDGYHVAAKPLLLDGVEYQPKISSKLGYVFGDRVLFGDRIEIKYETKGTTLANDAAIHLGVPFTPVEYKEKRARTAGDSILPSPDGGLPIFYVHSAELLTTLVQDTDVAFGFAAPLNDSAEVTGSEFIVIREGNKEQCPHEKIFKLATNVNKYVDEYGRGFIRRSDSGLRMVDVRAALLSVNDIFHDVHKATGMAIPAFRQEAPDADSQGINFEHILGSEYMAGRIHALYLVLKWFDVEAGGEYIKLATEFEAKTTEYLAGLGITSPADLKSACQTPEGKRFVDSLAGMAVALSTKLDEMHGGTVVPIFSEMREALLRGEPLVAPELPQVKRSDAIHPITRQPIPAADITRELVTDITTQLVGDTVRDARCVTDKQTSGWADLPLGMRIEHAVQAVDQRRTELGALTKIIGDEDFAMKAESCLAALKSIFYNALMAVASGAKIDEALFLSDAMIAAGIQIREVKEDKTPFAFPTEVGQVRKIPISFKIGDKVERAEASVRLEADGYHFEAGEIYINGNKFEGTLKTGSNYLLANGRVVSGDTATITFATKGYLGNDLLVTLQVPKREATDSVTMLGINGPLFEVRTPELLIALAMYEKNTENRTAISVIKNKAEGTHFVAAIPQSPPGDNPHNRIERHYGIDNHRDSSLEVESIYYVKKLPNGVVAFDARKVGYVKGLFEALGIIIPITSNASPTMVSDSAWQEGISWIPETGEAAAVAYMLTLADINFPAKLYDTLIVRARVYLKKLGIEKVKDLVANASKPEVARLVASMDATVQLFGMKNIRELIATNEKPVQEMTAVPAELAVTNEEIDRRAAEIRNMILGAARQALEHVQQSLPRENISNITYIDCSKIREHLNALKGSLAAATDKEHILAVLDELESPIASLEALSYELLIRDIDYRLVAYALEQIISPPPPPPPQQESAANKPWWRRALGVFSIKRR